MGLSYVSYSGIISPFGCMIKVIEDECRAFFHQVKRCITPEIVHITVHKNHLLGYNKL